MIHTDKLAPAVFSNMLRQGRGLALMHVMEYGLEGVEDLVLQACLTNQVYDPQCEPERSPWLYRMFKGSSQYPRFSHAILAALPAATELDDVNQLCMLTARMAMDGNVEAAQTLRNAVLQQDFSSDSAYFGCRALVLLDGMEGLAALGCRFGQTLQADPAAYVTQPDHLMDGFEDLPANLERLEQLATRDPMLAAYTANYRSERARSRQADSRGHRERTREQYPIDDVLAMAQAGGAKFRSVYRAFGMYATDEELERVLQHLVTATSPEHYLRLLWIFTKATMPRLEPRVLALAGHAAPEVRSAACQALSGITDPRIGELARAQVTASAFSASDFPVLALFRKNLSEGDCELIMSQLERLAMSDAEAHRFICKLVDICKHNNAPQVDKMAEWVQLKTPCSVCRKEALTRLQQRARLPAQIASECAFDANPDIQAIPTV